MIWLQALVTVGTAVAAATMPVITSSSSVDLGRVAAAGGSAARIDVTVDTTGKPIRCEVIIADKAPAFNSTACKAFMRTRFTAARDVDGAPITAAARVEISTHPIRNPSLVRHAGRAVDGADAPNSAGPPGLPLDFAIPINLLPEGGPFTTDVILTIDELGHVVRCDIAKSSKQASLDRLACTQMVKNSFDPVRDIADQPVRGLRQASVGFSAQ